MADTRKINFYEIFINNDLDCKQSIEEAIKKFNNLNRAKSNKRKKSIAGGVYMQVEEFHKVGFYFQGKSKVVRDEFPEIINKVDDSMETMSAEDDPQKGIPDETHFIISMNKTYPNPIIAVESCLKGPKSNDIRKYLNSMFLHSGGKGEFIFEPYYKFDYDNFLKRIGDVASIKFKVFQSEIDGLKQMGNKTGTYIRNSFSYGNPEYITFEFGINFQKKKKRHDSSSLKEMAIDFVSFLKKGKNKKDLFKRLDIKAQDNYDDGTLRLFDLIESKIASEVVAERKRPRSKYFNSNSLYEEIRGQIESDFGA